jgi:hypothetical protein
MQVVFNPLTGNVGHTSLAVRLPPRTAIFSVSPNGEFIGVRKLSESLSTPDLDIVTDWLSELRAQVPAPN